MARYKRTRERYENQSGDVFGELTLLHLAEPDRFGRKRWACRCSCGKENIVSQACLRADRSRMCHSCANTIHGKVKTAENQAWVAMRFRCGNPRCPSYPDYGGRGITVCERWSSFENFYQDMGPRPSKKHSLDRKDNNGNYCPENCRWATRTVQARNTRRNVLMTLGDKTQCIQDWADELGVSKHVIRGRIRLGWDEEKILTTTPHTRKKS